MVSTFAATYRHILFWRSSQMKQLTHINEQSYQRIAYRRNRSPSNHSQWSWACWVAFLFIVLQPLHVSSTEEGIASSRKLSHSETPTEPTWYSVSYKNPTLHWMTRLQDDQLFHGNQIIQSPYDEDILYVTTRSGKLLALSIHDGSILHEVSIPPRVIRQESGTEAWAMHCSSGISFGELNDGAKFLVYSVQDTPPEGSVYGQKTRVIAVSIPAHEVLWTSAALPGKTNGSPLVYYNKGNSKTYVVLTHNTQLRNNMDETSVITTGHITILDTVRGYFLWTDSEWNSGGDPLGYSPPGVVSSPITGMFSDGEYNSNDIVVWATSSHDGRGTQGFTFVLQLPMDFTGTQSDIEGLRTEPLKIVRWNSVVRPTFSGNGTHMFMGVGGSEVRGWVGETLFDEPATWGVSLVESSADPMAPVPAATTLSIDETRLFVPSAETDLACIDTWTGKIKWSLQGTSTFLAKSKVSPDDERIYVIQSVDGRIFCHDQRTGDLNWLASCDQFEEDCSNAVRADFEISRTGQFLIYGDVMGRIIALRLGDLVEHFDEPTKPPGSGMIDNTGDHIIWPDNPENNHSSHSGIALGGSIALIILATIISLASLTYIIFMNSLKTEPHPMQEPQSLDDETEYSSSDYSLPVDPDNAPDKYEDSMISQHKAPANEILYADLSPRICKDHSRKSLDSSFDNISFAAADRIAILLGTHNRIAPLQEDFSYGAAVLV